MVKEKLGKNKKGIPFSNKKMIMDPFDKSYIDGFPKFDSEVAHLKLFEAIKNEYLVIFYGAGVSRLAGCKGWYDLACHIIDTFYPEKFTRLETEELKIIAWNNPRKAISICYHTVESEDKLLNKYYEAIKKALKPTSNKRFKKIHELILNLGASCYVTTNIDCGAENVTNLEKRKIFDLTMDKNVLDFDLYNEGNIVYIHGSIKNINNAVFTIDKYISHYSVNEIKHYLKEIFKPPRTVLFIGYGLEEYDILENIFRAINNYKTKDDKSYSSCQHFILTPIYSKDIAKFRVEREYFKIFLVETIPYFIDYEGYDRLLQVLNKLNEEIENAKQQPLEIISKIDQVD
jgi:hypothetical protein